MSFATPASGVRAPARHAHIVDVLIAERAPRLAGSAIWPLLRPLLYAILDYGKARRMADAIAPLPGREALDYVSRLLALEAKATGLEHVPRQGRCVVVCNHPTGIADGVAAYDVLKGLRADLCFYANADAERVAHRFGEVLIPVEWVEQKRTRERMRQTLTLTREAMDAGRCLVIFPAGRISRRQADGALRDNAWMASAVSIARRHDAPILPLHVAGPWSALFHFFHGFSDELRDITLFHELLNKQGQAFALTAGPLISPGRLEGDPTEITAQLKAYVEDDLPTDPTKAFA
jgi:putative hemolysin